MEDHPKPFVEHLEELRLRLIKSFIAVALGTAIGYTFVDRTIAFISRPVGRFIFLAPTEAILARLKLALATGFVMAMPVVIYQIWKFIVIALDPLEKRSLIWILPVSYLLFVTGLSFGFFFMVPTAIKFLLSYSTPQVVANLSIEHYVNFLGTVCIALGAVFQMPLVTFFLSKVGVIDSRWLSEKRPIAILLIYVSSAFLTPGPDPITAIMLAVPTYALFECSILSARIARKS